MTEIFDISYNEIGVIKDLWERNRQYHENSSEYFAELYRDIDFDQRMKDFSGFNEETLKITVVKKAEEYIGYCISTINDDGGEVESLHVNELFRGRGFGKELMVKHLQWLKEKNFTTIGVTVSQENHAAISFYKNLGFYPSTLNMQPK